MRPIAIFASKVSTLPGRLGSTRILNDTNFTCVAFSIYANHGESAFGREEAVMISRLSEAGPKAVVSSMCHRTQCARPILCLQRNTPITHQCTPRLASHCLEVPNWTRSFGCREASIHQRELDFIAALLIDRGLRPVAAQVIARHVHRAHVRQVSVSIDFLRRQNPRRKKV